MATLIAPQSAPQFATDSATHAPNTIAPHPTERAGESWISVVSHLEPRYGGLSSAVPALGSAVAGAGRYSVRLTGFCAEGEHYAPAVAAGVDLRYFPVSRLAWLKNPGARRSFRELVASARGVHIHGLWQMSTSAAAHAARSEHKPYVVSAHGMLEAWALSNRKLKKSVYSALFERANLRSASCLHALTEAEAADYRKFGLTNPIAVIPNGVDVPASCSQELFFERFPALCSKRLILFLGRIHFKKGLDILSEAWARVSNSWPEAHLVLAGPDFENTQAQVQQMLLTLGVADRVTFTGMLGRDLKWSALRAAECFVLPSYSEGLSVSVLEAMGMGLPVVVTKQCNLPEVAEFGCGWTIQPRVGELESALTRVLRASAADLAAIGANGRALVARRYSWPAIGEQMSAVYSWLAGGSLPAQVHLQTAGGCQ